MTIFEGFLKIWSHSYVYFPIFCAVILFSVAFNLFDEMDTLMLGWNGMLFYFTIDLLLMLYECNLEYMVHHGMCFCLLMLRFGWDGDSYWIVYVPIALSMELSSLFLNLRRVLDKNGTLGMLNDIMFVIVWFCSRIFFALPRIWHSLLVNGADGGYPIPVYSAVTALTILHVYWAYLIIIKFVKIFIHLYTGKQK